MHALASLSAYNEGSGIIISRYKEREHFGDLPFITGQSDPNINYRAEGFCIYYRISREDFLDTLRLFREDYETFCELKDRIVFGQRLDKIRAKCVICSAPHNIENCEKVNLVIDRVKLAQQQNLIKENERNIYNRAGKGANTFARFKDTREDAKSLIEDIQEELMWDEGMSQIEFLENE